MKKTLLLISTTLLSVAASAQITVTQSDFISPGETMIQAADTVMTLMVGPSGANVSWNYSSLVADTKDTIDVVLPASTPFASDFPGANIAGYSHGSSGTAYFYINSNASAFELDGYAAQGLLVNLNPNEVATPLPATFGTSVTNNFGYDIKLAFSFPPIDSFRIKSTTVKTGSFDSYGTLTMAYGTYNVIRSSDIRIVTDSMFTHSAGPFPPAGWSFAQVEIDTIYHYSYIANNVGYPIVDIDSSRADGKSAKFLFSEPVPTSVKNYSVVSSDLYPNPATTAVNFIHIGSSNDIISVYNLTGNLIRKEVLVNGLNVISVEDLAAGLYIYNVSGTDGNVSRSGKFTVAK